MKRTYKKVIVFIVGLALAHILILVSGNDHLYPTLQNTVFKGRLGPEIDEFQVFTNREVKAGVHQAWNEKFTDKKLNEDELTFHDDLQSVAFVIIQNDSIRFEQYWEGYNQDSRSNSFSMAKSLVSIAVGAAIREGYIQSIDQKLSEFVPEFNGGDEVSIKDLLTMNSGINFDENYINPFAYPARANYGNRLWDLTTQYEYTGENKGEFKYLSGNTQLLSFVVSRATGMTLSEYFSQSVWQRIGAKNTALWSLDKADSGLEKAFCCFNSNVRDFARIGKLYLNNGVWNGDTIVPSWYVRSSWSAHSLVEEDQNTPCTRYGYQWWMMKYENKDVFYARGILGQYILVIPEDDLIVCRLGHKRIKPKDYDPPGEVENYIRMAYRLIAN